MSKISSNKIEELTPLQQSFLVIEELESKLDALKYSQSEPIAIIGMGCRFPGGASTPKEFWEVLKNGVDAITEVPKDRWNLDKYYDSDPESAGKIYTRYGGFIEFLDQFDANFFGISPREAIHLDPQQRLLLEVCWEAIEYALINPTTLNRSQTGVFIGICGNDYNQSLFTQNRENIDAYVASGNAHSTASGRISYILGLLGPSIAVDTACSSSLVSVHLACASLRKRECNLALAGGVNRIISPEVSIALSKARMLSFDGRCKTFDASADGFIRSEGCGVVVLKRLSDAVADKDNILALIRGSAINQDGHTSGLTVPNGPSQQAVIRQALSNGKVKPADISYCEAHGTGTSLGDPIEVGALGTVFGTSHSQEQPLIVGSVKTNIGHSEAAAGIAGLIKIVLQLQNQQIAPSLHFNQPNPYINWSELPVKIPTQITPWPTNGKSRMPGSHMAGVSSFGFSGTNAHIVVESAPIPESQVKKSDDGERPWHILTISAKSEKALQELAQSYEEFLTNDNTAEIGDVCFSANTGRSHFKNRFAIVAPSAEKLAQQLKIFQNGEDNPGVFRGKVNSKSPKIAFLFTGQGSQYINMGRQLYETQPVFRQTLNQCCEILETYLDKPLLEILYGDEASENVLAQTAYTQPALFAIEYALYKLWSSWGIKPSVVMGHSVGEYVAATVAGVLSLEEGLKLIAHRGRLMQQLPPGGEMLSVMASVEQINQIITPYADKVTIAGINGPESIVISGEAEAINTVKEIFETQEIKTKQLQVSHGFHSHLMEPMLADFRLIASEITYNQPSIPLVSNVTGERAQESIATPDYWVNHLLKPVKFAQSMATLHQEGYEVFLEIGPKPTLLGMGRQCLPEDVGVWLPSLRAEREDWQQMLQSLGELYVRGVKVDWLGFDKDYSRKKVVLPTYPFQRQRYWIETEEHQQTGAQDVIKEKGNIMKTRRDKIIQELNSLIFQVLGFDASSEIDIHDNLLEMGADSLTLMEVGSKVEKTYGINIPIRKFFEELTNLDALATYIDVNLSPQWGIQSQLEETLQQSTQSQSENTSIEPRIGEKVFETFREGIIQQQLEVMSHIMSKQLEVLQNNGTSTEWSFSKINKQFKSASATSSTVDSSSKKHNQILKKESDSANFELNQVLNIEQKSYLEKFIAAYTRKTQKSKQRALAYRSVLADKRAAVGFRLNLKEIKYPIVGESSSGSRIWDIDGNEYIDISMGFGVHLFGHQPQFIIEALQNQLEVGMQIGPQAKLAGEVAQLIHELTGMERVALCNSGTEAVMTALRLARLATGRDKIVIFSGSYHGQFDGTLAVPLTNSLDDNPKAAPILPGILQKMVDDVIVLKYDRQESLDIIKAYSHELAAVLVEPVQSRRPDLQPKEFLQQLRQLTQKVDIPLIFDEIITGFRIHPRGTQAWFGIEADITTYGKCVGGGIPIGIIAGKAAYMDGIDGGQWNYGDNSYPQKLQTYFAGTFNKNPLSMAAAQAVLKHLKSQGVGLQENLNQRTSKLITGLNTYFEQEYVPIKMINFGSMFRFVASGNNELSQPIALDILFYKLIEKGVYMWEGKNGPACFLSTAHTDEDINYIISAVKDSISEMVQGGFFQKNKQQNHQTDVKDAERLRGEL